MTLIDCTDRSSCIRESLLSIGAIVTLTALIYALYQRIQAIHSRSSRDCFVLCLSILQTFLSSIHYTIKDNGEIVLAARVIKVLQTLVISWIFLAATFPRRK